MSIRVLEDEISALLNQAIMTTPTGECRERLTDLNISILGLFIDFNAKHKCYEVCFYSKQNKVVARFKIYAKSREDAETQAGLQFSTAIDRPDLMNWSVDLIGE